MRNDYTHAYICTFEADENAPKHTPFLLDLIESKGSSKLDIPANCPLEDYKPIEP
nr:hypothetical protein [uncultured Flavobacterium sp.]